MANFGKSAEIVALKVRKIAEFLISANLVAALAANFIGRRESNLLTPVLPHKLEPPEARWLDLT
ncbi:MAG: hypothetical protein ACREQ1_09345 [Woeseiaceae bacterium]